MNRINLQEAETLLPSLSALRREFHRCPEPGNREFRTAERIEQWLHGCGIETQRLLDTAVVGTLRGALPGRTVALRADMDALPVTEETGADFASQTPGMMHACGHDVHMTAVLGAAKLLSLHRDTLHGTVKFFFEPDEEGCGGAQRMIAAGCMGGVDAVFGAHVSPDLPAGTIGVRYGKFYAASDTFSVTVHGRGAHGAEPEKGIDALAAAAEMVCALCRLPARFPGQRSVLSIGTLQAGTAINVIADCADFTGIIRTLGPENRAEMKRLFRETIMEIARATGTAPDIRLHESYPGVVNGDAATKLAEETATALFGAANVVRLSAPTMTTEDFGYFIDAATGAYYHIGAGCTKPLHNPAFLPDERAIFTAAAVHAAVAERFLNAYK